MGEILGLKLTHDGKRIIDQLRNTGGDLVITRATARNSINIFPMKLYSDAESLHGEIAMKNPEIVNIFEIFVESPLHNGMEVRLCEITFHNEKYYCDVNLYRGIYDLILDNQIGLKFRMNEKCL